jgi:hypothetical protein
VHGRHRRRDGLQGLSVDRLDGPLPRQLHRLEGVVVVRFLFLLGGRTHVLAPDAPAVLGALDKAGIALTVLQPKDAPAASKCETLAVVVARNGAILAADDTQQHERTFFIQLLFLQRHPVLCASALVAESADCWAAAGGGAAAAAAAMGYMRPPYDAASDAALDAAAAPDPARPSAVPSDGAPGSSAILRYLVSNACGFRAKTWRWASLRIFSHRGTLQHSRHRHCVPQYNLAPKHWQYSLRHRVRLQVHPMLWTSSRRVEWSWLGDVAASRSSSRFFPRRLLAEEDDDAAATAAAAAADDMGVRLTA